MQGHPLAIDGILYYSSPYNQIYALDGATGQMIWTYKHKLNEDLVARQTHSPYNRGIVAGYGNLYMGTLDGKLAAIDMKTGEQVWRFFTAGGNDGTESDARKTWGGDSY